MLEQRFTRSDIKSLPGDDNWSRAPIDSHGNGEETRVGPLLIKFSERGQGVALIFYYSCEMSKTSTV